MAAAKARKKTPRAAPRTKTPPKPTRRSSPAPVDLEIDPDVLEFIAAIDHYRKAYNRPFPGWSEVLQILKQLGYRKPAGANAPPHHSPSSAVPSSSR
jgi:hypothetical protein